MKSSFKKSVAAGLLAAALLFSVGCSRGDKSFGESVDDMAISTKVKTAFAQDPGVKAIEVKVETYKGTVQLAGWVNTPEEKARAEQLAKSVPGVKAVDNKIILKVEPAATPATTPAPAAPKAP